MTHDVAASIGRLRHVLDGTVRFATNYDSGPPAWQGTPGSVVAGELAEAPTMSPAWEQAVRTLLSGVRLQLFTVSRHLKSISNLLATEMPPFGPAILARSALETAARAWWLVDSQIDVRQRVARGLTDRLYSADYAAALAREYGVDDSYFSEPPSKIEGICSDLSLGITGRERNRYVGTEARQTATKLCADLLRSIDPDPERSANRPSVAFAYYSAISHGTYYALLHAFDDTGELREGTTVLVAQVPLSDLVQAVELGLGAFVALLERLVEYLGWDRAPWEGWQDHIVTVLDELRPPPQL